MRAGENVCIHATTPTQDGSAFASVATRWIPSEEVTTGRQTRSAGRAPASRSIEATCWLCSATCASTSSP